MSVKYIPVQWNNNKWFYDAVMIVCAAAYLLTFLQLAPPVLDHARPVTPDILNARAFGTCAFLMLSVILAIGPLARLDRRFLPLLYNRRHFGVLTAFVALTHATFILNWYYAFSPTPKLEALLGANVSYGQWLGFPFEIFGVFALLVLFVLAATSHDFWLKFLSPPIWKGLHFLIYPAYAAIVAHVALGSLQDRGDLTTAGIVGFAAFTVSALHLAAAFYEWRYGDPMAQADPWAEVCAASDIEEGFAKVVRLTNNERVAIFRMDGKLSAISNACAHQNGPLGEGRIVDGCVTCPWHGFQYRVTDGCSPAPFTEKVPTYNLRVENGVVSVNRTANPPGTYVEPVPVREIKT
ncbi:MAG: ferric reductase-like transmembrane domain-containing protein [Hyphomicrobiales bacterium]|nr:ferric reductase-like transmembrane domain-containing protein [Hyphomicrobiales bacterium]